MTNTLKAMQELSKRTCEEVDQSVDKILNNNDTPHRHNFVISQIFKEFFPSTSTANFYEEYAYCCCEICGKVRKVKVGV